MNRFLNINCTQYKEGRCMHPSAGPLKLFVRPYCLLVHPHIDPRIPSGCQLQIFHQKPDWKPQAPPASTESPVIDRETKP